MLTLPFKKKEHKRKVKFLISYLKMIILDYCGLKWYSNTFTISCLCEGMISVFNFRDHSFQVAIVTEVKYVTAELEFGSSVEA